MARIAEHGSWGTVPEPFQKCKSWAEISRMLRAKAVSQNWCKVMGTRGLPGGSCSYDTAYESRCLARTVRVLPLCSVKSGVSENTVVSIARTRYSETLCSLFPIDYHFPKLDVNDGRKCRLTGGQPKGSECLKDTRRGRSGRVQPACRLRPSASLSIMTHASVGRAQPQNRVGSGSRHEATSGTQN
jgi:hypothetical protein